MITINEIIEKRKRVWKEKKDILYDAELVNASIKKVLSSESLVAEIKAKPYSLIEVAFSIVDKKKNSVPFFLNEVQKDFLTNFERLGTSKPYYILKGRQQGFTSLITAMQLCYAIVQKNFSGFTLADCGDNTKAIFNDKARMVYYRLPELLKPTEKFNSTNELFFDKLNSSWRIATATSDVGRSRTLSFVHFSEVAFYQTSLANLQKGIGEATTEGAFVVYETTANGFNEAKDLWDSESCNNLFYEWWRTEEYKSTEYQYLEKHDSWLAKRVELLKAKGLTKEQITWYCKKYSGYLDKNTIKQEYPISPTEAFISSGECVFDKECLANQIARCSDLQVAKIGYFKYRKRAENICNSNGGVEDIDWHIEEIEFVESSDGYIYIHEEPQIKKDKDNEIIGKAPYVIGGDTAGLGNDFFTAKIINNLNGATVATLHKQKIDEDLYAEQLYCLGKYYNDALIGIETNYSRQPTRVLEKLSYPNLYTRERVDKITNKPEQIYGFETTSKTRPVIIAELIQLMREDPTIEVHIQTLKEMTTFIRKDNGKQEAQDGYHDDLIMALAIAHFISNKQQKTWIDRDIENEDFIAENFKLENSTGQFINWEEY